MAGDETARLAHALDARVYNFFEVHCQSIDLIDYKIYGQSPLLYVMCYVVSLLFINAYILLKLAQKPPQKSKIFLGGACPQTPLVSACFARC